MPEPLQGTPQSVEQPANGNQQQEQAPPQEGQQPPTTTPQPTVEEIQARYDAANQRATQLEESYRNLQADYTRKAQALAQLAGSQQPPQQQDPIAPYVQRLVQQGYSEKDARAVAGVAHDMMMPLQQQMQQQAQIGQQMSQVDYMLNQAMNFDPSLFPSQQIVDQVRQSALQMVNNGGSVNHQMMVTMANDFNYWERRNNPQQQRPQQFAPQQPALPPQPFANGMTRITPGFAPQQQQPVITQDQRAAEDFLNSRFDLKKP